MIMKTFSINMIALLIILSGCAKIEKEISLEESVTFSAIFAEDMTKTSISPGDGGISVTSWNSSDKIGVFTVKESEEIASNLPYISQNEGLSTTFLAENTAVPPSDGSEKMYYAYFPYSESSSTYKSVRISAKPLQNYIDGDNPDKMFAVASATSASTNVSLNFRNQLALLEFGLKGQGLNIREMSIEAVEEEVPLSGSYLFSFANPDIQPENTEKSNVITVSFGENGLALGNSYTYIPVAVLPFSCTGGLRLKFTDDKGNIFVKEIWKNSAVGDSDIPGKAVIHKNMHIRQPLSDILANSGDGYENLSSPYGTSNSYIASKPNTKYKFNVSVMGNGYVTEPVRYNLTYGTMAGITPTPLNINSAKILWQSSPDLLQEVAGVEDSYFRFTTGSQPGNIVVAGYESSDCSGEIAWSWHIWITQDEVAGEIWKVSSTIEQYSNLADPIMMDRNLGALSKNAGEGVLGLKYQWGRKDPFLYSSGETVQAAIPTYDKDNVRIPNSMTSTGLRTAFDDALAWRSIDGISIGTEATIENSIKHPMSFITRTETTVSDWLYFNLETNRTRDDLWGYPRFPASANDLGHKTIYDPCPAGWRIPHGYVFSNVSGNIEYLGNGVNFRYDGINNTYLPSAGHIRNDNGTIRYTGSYGYYWTGAIGSAKTSKGYYLKLATGTPAVTNSSEGKSYGFSVRCMKEK